MISIKIGNLFESKATTLVNTVNCVGIMGKGIALDFKTKYPDMYKEYIAMCKDKQVRPGQPYIYKDLLGTSIINFPTKDHWRSPSKLSYITTGLKWFIDNYQELEITSIAFPPLGCGNGGLSWELVGPIMYKMLKDLPIEIEIYAPYGTKPELLSIDFLENNCIYSAKDILGSKSVRFNSKWLLIPYIIQELNSNRYSLTVGRTILQKICYVLTRSGVNTGFHFIKGFYGPYSREVNNAIMTLSNGNLIVEKQLGRMISVIAAPNYKLDKTKFTEKDLSNAEKTLDLFSRIKKTDHAEIISTVIFATDDLLKKNNTISEKDVYDYVMEWKPRWINTKSIDISETIRNLAILGWIDVLQSDNLPHSTELII